ncbi:MAG: hypothetical protein WCF18_23005 [Chthoniobacteraceae bacterium]
MSAHLCCQTRRALGARRAAEIAGWVFPSAALALLPKCPMCVAAYVALGTGLALTPASANLLLQCVTAICLNALAFCLARRIVKTARRQHSLGLQPAS